jgi:hypothetical protein
LEENISAQTIFAGFEYLQKQEAREILKKLKRGKGKLCTLTFCSFS